MESDNINKKNRKVLFILSGLLLVLLVYYAVISSIGPSRKLAAVISEFDPPAEEAAKTNEEIFSDSAYLSLLKEKSWFQAKTLMAQTDSIYLAINLADSTADIEISGVTVHSAKISNFRLSKILRTGKRNAIYTMFSQPLTIQSDIATIKKEPVMIKIAPKDTSEYQPDVIPDTSFVEHVNLIFEVSHGMRIYIYQEESDKPAARGSTFRFDLSDRLYQTWISLKSAALFKVPEYHPYIRIKIPRNDVKIIYRALPRNGQVAVYN